MAHFTIVLHFRLEGESSVERLAESLSSLLAEGGWIQRDGVPSQLPCLSERECRLLAALAQCDTIAEAANQMCISSSTARKYLENIYRKLGVHSLHRALVLATRYGLIESTENSEMKREKSSDGSSARVR